MQELFSSVKVQQSCEKELYFISIFIIDNAPVCMWMVNNENISSRVCYYQLGEKNIENTKIYRLCLIKKCPK